MVNLFFPKNSWLFSTVDNFYKTFVIGVSQYYRYAHDKTKQNAGALSLTSQKVRTVISVNFFHFKIQFYLHNITLWWDINHKFNTSVFNSKLFYPCTLMHMIIINYYLPVQTHRDNYRPTSSISLWK